MVVCMESIELEEYIFGAGFKKLNRITIADLLKLEWQEYKKNGGEKTKFIKEWSKTHILTDTDEIFTWYYEHPKTYIYIDNFIKKSGRFDWKNKKSPFMFLLQKGLEEFLFETVSNILKNE